MTGFEPATTRPPDVYSNRTELHPELRLQRYCFIFILQIGVAHFIFRTDSISPRNKATISKKLFLFSTNIVLGSNRKYIRYRFRLCIVQTAAISRLTDHAIVNCFGHEETICHCGAAESIQMAKAKQLLNIRLFRLIMSKVFTALPSVHKTYGYTTPISSVQIMLKTRPLPLYCKPACPHPTVTLRILASP